MFATWQELDSLGNSAASYLYDTSLGSLRQRSSRATGSCSAGPAPFEMGDGLGSVPTAAGGGASHGVGPGGHAAGLARAGGD